MLLLDEFLHHVGMPGQQGLLDGHMFLGLEKSEKGNFAIRAEFLFLQFQKFGLGADTVEVLAQFGDEFVYIIFSHPGTWLPELI